MKLGPTELRILFGFGVLYLLYDPYATVFGRENLLFDVAGAFGIVGLLVTMLVSVARNTLLLISDRFVFLALGTES